MMLSVAKQMAFYSISIISHVQVFDRGTLRSYSWKLTYFERAPTPLKFLFCFRTLAPLPYT